MRAVHQILCCIVLIHTVHSVPSCSTRKFDAVGHCLADKDKSCNDYGDLCHSASITFRGGKQVCTKGPRPKLSNAEKDALRNALRGGTKPKPKKKKGFFGAQEMEAVWDEYDGEYEEEEGQQMAYLKGYLAGFEAAGPGQHYQTQKLRELRRKDSVYSN
eukprot:CAMPEP_0202691786 /NCGR_PEP_ID=MMETSP1385-20130828/6399_1 /ASSEMBLY_ACC=CAM_ASM_000861 /TAXON_ID=933848 /ORGANISM="Elphidium margaritaceum" /LENGTH=158 /DNA_ID=CAMNT_0049347239 /DNA_START=25 /DNA_END=501 /DNA_ORIENTATION=-